MGSGVCIPELTALCLTAAAEELPLSIPEYNLDDLSAILLCFEQGCLSAALASIYHPRGRVDLHLSFRSEV